MRYCLGIAALFVAGCQNDARVAELEQQLVDLKAEIEASQREVREVYQAFANYRNESTKVVEDINDRFSKLLATEHEEAQAFHDSIDGNAEALLQLSNAVSRLNTIFGAMTDSQLEIVSALRKAGLMDEIQGRDIPAGRE